MAALLAGQAQPHLVGDCIEQVVELRALLERELTQRVQRLALGERLLRFVPELEDRAGAQ